MLEARILAGVEEVPREAWDRLTTGAAPFFEWEFLAACEEASAVPEQGVQAQHVTVWDDDVLVAALPLYLKGDGRGEFIYDYAWYHFAARVGLDYYPKAVSMCPFTPVSGPHFLVAPDRDDGGALRELTLAVVERWAQELGLPGVHCLFVTEEEAASLESSGYLRRLSSQLHWRNEGFGEFADFLARFRHKDRVKIKRERRRVAEQGLRFEVRTGGQITDDDLEAMFAFYERTCRLHGTGSNYLKRGTWERLFSTWQERLVLFFAWRGDARQAGSLCVRKGEDLYGRYWGARSDEISCLYFELAFYRPIEHAIAQGVQRFWVGFGNTRAKFSRGLHPAPTHSAHLLFDPKLRRVIGAHLEEDRRAVEEEIEACRRASKLKPLEPRD